MEFAANIFTGMIDTDGTIYEAGTGRKRQKIGVDSQREEELVKQIAEMQEVLESYYNKLVELGEIVPPKTAEQIALEQAEQQREINLTLLDAIENLKNEVKALSGKKERPEKPNKKGGGTDQND